MSGIRQLYYVLNDEKAVIETTLLEWAKFYEDPKNRIVKHTRLLDRNVLISTVFLGIDHNWGGGTPILFETMTFVDGEEDKQWRYATWVEAISHHNEILAKWTRTLNQHDTAITDLIEQSAGINLPND